MDEKDFKKHLKDLAHGHHHPEEHDWATESSAGTATKKVASKTAKAAKAAKPAKPAKKKSAARARK
jgi:hypothetical protein